MHKFRQINTFKLYSIELKKTLQMAQEITTKCVCIIRHKKGNKKAKIYEVIIENRGDKIYNFIKGNEIKKKAEEVISERNKLIAEDKVGFYYEKYFLIIEYEIPFFKGEFEEYADLFEFMDVPGLNEKSDIICSNEDNKKN